MENATETAKPEHYVYTRGIWRPTQDELDRLTPARQIPGPQSRHPKAFIRGRGSNVRVLLGGDILLTLETMKAGAAYFVDTYIDLRPDGKTLRRTVRIYPDPSEKALANEQELTLDHWARPLTMHEVLGFFERRNDGEFMQVQRKRRGMIVDEVKNRGRDGYELRMDRTGHVINTFDLERVARVADDIDWRHPDKKRGDWELVFTQA